MSLVYFILWVIFNGRLTLEIFLSGLFIAVSLDLFVKKILKINFYGSFVKFLTLLPYALLYAAVLLIEIVRANFAIIKLVLAPDIQVEPCLVKFNTPLKSQAARAALANSITLTPGTITVSLEGNQLLVHALNRDIAKGLQDSLFEKLLSQMEAKIYA